MTIMGAVPLQRRCGKRLQSFFSYTPCSLRCIVSDEWHGPKSIAEIDFAELAKRKYTPLPGCWSDQVLYFLMLDRFSYGNERGGHKDAQAQPVITG
jgi:hypothetical protein